MVNYLPILFHKKITADHLYHDFSLSKIIARKYYNPLTDLKVSVDIYEKILRFLVTCKSLPMSSASRYLDFILRVSRE
jgi:hypothetical protein